MNTLQDSIRIEFKAKAVAMKVISREEALVFGLLKAKGAMHVLDLSLATGLTKLKVTKALELFVAVEKCRIDGDTAIFLDSVERPAAVSNVETTQEQTTAANPATPSIIERQKNKGRPANVEEVLDFIRSFLNTKNYSYLNRPDTDFVASANYFYDFYESKGWQVGRSPMKSWQSAARRAFTDLQADGKKPWAVVKYRGSDMAANMDAKRAQAPAAIAAAPTVQQLPPPVNQPQVVQAIPVAPAAPSEANQRRGILANRLKEKMGPQPQQQDFCADPFSGVSNNEYLQWQDALQRYNHAYMSELENLIKRFANVPTQDLYTVQIQGALCQITFIQKWQPH